MDEWLDERGLYRKNTALDASCLFRAVAEQILPANSINGHNVLRRLCVNFISQNRREFESKICGDFDEYVAGLASPRGWGTVLELDIISRIFRVDFLAYFGPDPPIQITQNGFDDIKMLCVTNTCFYDSVYTKTHIQNLGFCQSLVYRILYENVFKLNDLEYAVTKMLHDKAARAQRERYLNNQQLGGGDGAFDSYVEDNGTVVNTKEIINTGAILFPYKVAKALDPDIYRNVEFDNWVESQRGKPLLPNCSCFLEVSRRNNFWFLSGGPLRVGVKCQVRFQGRNFTAYVHELSPDKGPAVVYIEEFSQKMTVPYEDLIPLPRSTSKPDWSYAHKHQMISRLGPRSSKDVPVDQHALSKIQNRRSEAENATPEPDSTVWLQANATNMTNHSLIYTQNESITKWNLVNKMAEFSICDDCSDLPLNDLATLRFFYNMGIEYFHKGTYITDQAKGFEEPVMETPMMVQVCQGAPLIQPPPPPPPPPLQPQYPVTPITPNAPNMIMASPPTLIAGPPPPIAVCPSSPMISCTPMQVNPNVPLVPGFPPTPCQEPDQMQLRYNEGAPNGNKERGRNSRFNKPPRFQRIAAQRCDEQQIPEITSTTMEPAQLPVAVVPPYQVSTIPIVYDPENAENVAYVDSYQEYSQIMPVMDHRMYLEGDNNYQYYMLPHLPVYF